MNEMLTQPAPETNRKIQTLDRELIQMIDDLLDFETPAESIENLHNAIYLMLSNPDINQDAVQGIYYMFTRLMVFIARLDEFKRYHGYKKQGAENG